MAGRWSTELRTVQGCTSDVEEAGCDRHHSRQLSWCCRMAGSSVGEAPDEVVYGERLGDRILVRSTQRAHRVRTRAAQG